MFFSPFNPFTHRAFGNSKAVRGQINKFITEAYSKAKKKFHAEASLSLAEWSLTQSIKYYLRYTQNI